jgi:uncharacterized protein (TIGR00369 family)
MTQRGDLGELRAVAERIVRSPFGELVDMRVESVEPDRVRVRLPFRPEVVTVGELVHGGAIAALVDVAATAACWSGAEAGPAARGTTVGFSLSFLEGAVGVDLIADARVVRRGGTLSVCEVSVSGASRGEVARALVTYKLQASPGVGSGERKPRRG